MNEICMCPDVVNSVKTKAQTKYDEKMERYNANKKRKEEKALSQLNKPPKSKLNTKNKHKKGTNNVEVSVRDPYWLYGFKIINKQTREIHYKIGKADVPIKRISQWLSKIKKKLGNTVEVKHIWSKRCVYHNTKKGYIYYMTKNPKLYGDDADYIFRKLLYTYFSVKTYSYIYNNKTITIECCDFNTTDDNEVIEKCNLCYKQWIEKINNTPEDVKTCDIFVRYNYKENSKNNKENKKEFTEEQYNYQKNCFEWINKNAFEGINEDFYIRVPCGGGKTSISMCGLVLLSKYLDYRPILVLSGLNSVKGAFKDDSEKYKYCGINVDVYDIDEFNLDIWKENKELGIVSLVCTTCQSSVKSQKEENYEVADENTFSDKEVQYLSIKLKLLLDSGVRFSCGVTDEAHKIVFGNKMKSVFPLIRNYHIDTGINFFHMSGTGFNINHRFPKNKRFEIDFSDIQKEQGDTAVRSHYIVCENNMFLPYFYKNIDRGWDILLNEECVVNSKFKDVDSINCISSIKYGFVKPVIVAYMESTKDVRRSFDYLHKKYSFDDVLIISANGCKDTGDEFVRNDYNGNICKISNENAHTEVISQVRQAVAENKMVILLNVNKFVESWTIKEMNVQFMLRNIKSPDTFGQAICRTTRTYTHEKHVIKKDAFIFLFGDTFVTMAYKYDNIIRDNSNSDKKSKEPFVFLSELDTVYMGGKKYSYKERNLIDLRKKIDKKMMQLNVSADCLINNVITNKFPIFVEKLMRHNVIYFKKLTSGTNTISVDLFDDGEDKKSNINTENNNNTEGIQLSFEETTYQTELETPEIANVKSSKNKDENISAQFKQLKTFLSKLQLEAIMNCHLGSFDYDTLVKGMEEHMTSKQNKIAEYVKTISQSFECENEYKLFKKFIENWLEEQYCTID